MISDTRNDFLGPNRPDLPTKSQMVRDLTPFIHTELTIHHYSLLLRYIYIYIHSSLLLENLI